MAAEDIETELIGLLNAVSDRYEELSAAAHVSVMDALDLYSDRNVGGVANFDAREPIDSLIRQAVRAVDMMLLLADRLEAALRHVEAKAHLVDALARQ